jgi:CBS domain-containing protein
MLVTSKRTIKLTAEDLMSRTLVRLPETMPLRDAARLLLRNHVGGAPVVDAQGRCIGVLSAIDFLRLAERPREFKQSMSPPLPLSCQFQAEHWTDDGEQIMLCLLPPGVCPIQMRRTGAPGEESLICTQPRCVLADWQVVDLEKLPVAEVRHFMSPDPVTVRPDTSVRTLARRMTEAHIHRIIVVNEEHRPVGIVTSTDLLAVLAYGDDEPAGAAVDAEC